MTPSALKTYRIKHKMTQRQLADKIGIDQSQVSRWEAGETPVPKWLENLIKCWEEIQNNKKGKTK